jgi:SAM-dependent methyltransferase
MTIFDNYARYYDLLYRDKDYVGEAQFINKIIKNYAPQAASILELGCGTGIHASLLAKEGYHVQGVDQSSQMLETANDRLINLDLELRNRLNFTLGDVRHVRLTQKFDVIISLFHVVSYQTTNADLQATFATVKKHLAPNGIFIFDVWYGAAVLSDRPTVRVKRLEDDKIKVTRIAEPVMYPNDNLVNVNYDVFIEDKLTGSVEELQETHTMRYLFKPELENLLENCQLKIIDSKEWVTQKEPSFETWGVYFVVS